MDFFSKTDLITMYNVSTPRSFERLIGQEGVKILGWKPGQQRFNPKQIRELKELIGKPLRKDELYT